MKRVSLAAASLVLFAVWTPPVQAQGASVDGAVRRQATEFIDAWNAHDNVRVMALFDGPTGWFMLGGDAIATLDSLRIYNQTQFNRRTADNFKWARMQVKQLGPDAAHFQGLYGGRIVFKDGRTFDYPDNASMTALFERRGGVWKITSVAWTNGAAKITTK